MKLNWNLLGEGAAKQYTFHGGSKDIFLELHILLAISQGLAFLAILISLACFLNTPGGLFE